MSQAAISSINVTFMTKQEQEVIKYIKSPKINWQMETTHHSFWWQTAALIDELCCDFTYLL